MKILNVNMSMDPVTGGGTAERTYQISRFLASAGCDCTILTTDAGLHEQRIEQIRDKGVRLVALPCVMRRFYIPKWSPGRLSALVAQADIVHLMNHWTVLNAIVYKICRSMNKPYVVCPAGALPIFGRSGSIKKLYNHLIGHRIIEDASGHVAIPKSECEDFEAYGIDAGKVDVIPNGVDPGEYTVDNSEDFRSNLGVSNDPLILFVGRLNPIKGPDLLLEAFIDIQEQVPDHHLVFAGPDGGMLNLLKERTHQAGLESRVHFTGYIGGIEKAKAYHAADVLAIPSRQEAMSIVVLEAGISGTATIMTDQCGFNEIEAHEAGLIVPATANGIGKGLATLLTAPDRRTAMAENLHQYVGSNFTWDVIIQQYLQLYHRILGS